MSAILRCVDLSKHFGAVKAISHVNLDVEEGSLHSIIGPNGAGKTTLFNCITAETAPTSGKVLFEGQVISGKRPDQLPPLGISRSFQRTSVFARMTVSENVWVSAFPKYATRGVELFRNADSHPEVSRVIRQTLEEVGLAGYADAPAAELAHGDQRLLDFAIAIAPKPKLLLLDEPTAGLSRQDTQRVMHLIDGLKGRYTLVLIEHKMDVVMRISDHITVMYFGEVLSQGTPAEIRADPKVREAYLGKRA